MVEKNIIGTILIPADVDTGEEKLQDGTIVKWQVIARGYLANLENQEQTKLKRLAELRTKVGTVKLPSDFKPLTREEANEREN
jgi:hypothetical protein